MRSGFLVALVSAVMAVAPLQAIAGDWSRYDNVRFAYAIDIPPDFSEVAEAENSDGGVSASADGKAELRVWGGYLVDSDFKSEIAGRVQSDTSEGWAISYDRRTGTNASWSGSKSGRVFYARSMKGCDDAAIYFRLEYDRADLDAYHGIVGRLVKSLHATC
ncbi:hypothetical protein IHQ71_10990 [Rhizobium sp. TH2]|uniref:hypothetical protein n=1 Tax=Rhizobium sp. TH2 TaxID=2775403 RepID=UPI002157DFA4|nr:hypothetical protein [Rhizobium sp. TH2]UVC11052.1 hypothetical protein IHQ71_10990 [Rhizobium sp. TH2]